MGRPRVKMVAKELGVGEDDEGGVEKEGEEEREEIETEKEEEREVEEGEETVEEDQDDDEENEEKEMEGATERVEDEDEEGGRVIDLHTTTPLSPPIASTATGETATESYPGETASQDSSFESLDVTESPADSVPVVDVMNQVTTAASLETTIREIKEMEETATAPESDPAEATSPRSYN